MTSTIIKRVVGLAAGLVLALGLSFGATAPADAANKNVWDRVAQCETGQRWRTHSVPGYSGGLGFAHSSWRAYGGKTYARLAYQASRAEQIAIARRILADVGRGAWPTCGRRAGLTKANGQADRHATASGSSSSGSSSANAATAKWTKKERAFAHKDARVKKAANRAFVRGKTVRVRKGDDLLKIARRNHVKGGWKSVYRMNETKFDSQVRAGSRIFIGQIVRIKR